MNDPRLYSKSNSQQIRDNIYVLDKYLDLTNIKKDPDQGEMILDIGCGDGYVTSELLLPKMPVSLKKLIGTDISENMVKFAKETHKHERLDFRQLDISSDDDCGKFDEKFDYIFSFFCFHWIPEQRKAFTNVYKLLKPGGDILFSFVGSASYINIYQKFLNHTRWAPYISKEMIVPYHNCENIEEVIETLLTEIGFENCKCVVEKRQHMFDNWKQQKQSIIAISPLLSLLSPRDRDQYIQDFTQELRNILNNKFELDEDSDEQTILTYTLITVKARKPDGA